jgi:cellulose synthase/poly-beta-1,6-N-acetylglucosamine synthase-like glycosyltransferase
LHSDAGGSNLRVRLLPDTVARVDWAVQVIGDLLSSFDASNRISLLYYCRSLRKRGMSLPVIFRIVFWASWGLIAYTYGLFPLILAWLARRVKQTTAAAAPFPDRELPSVALVIAAYNEEAVMAAKIGNIRQLDYPDLTVLIGSDGSDDGTNAILQDCNDARTRPFLFAERRGKISVLNDLVAQTDADLIVMSDANTMFAPDAIRKLVAPFADPRVGCVSGELSLEQNGGVSGEGLYWKYEGWIKRNESKLGFLIGCNGGIFALRRTLYERLPASTIVEDFVLTLRVLEQRYLVRFEPEARATEPPCATSRAEMVRKIRIGAGGWQALGLTKTLLHPRHGACAFAFWGHKVLRWLVPLFCLTAFCSNIALLQNGAYGVLFALQIAGGLIALLAYRAGLSTLLPRWSRPISYFYLMNYALGRGFLRFLLGTQRVTWERAVPMKAPDDREGTGGSGREGHQSALTPAESPSSL